MSCEQGVWLWTWLAMAIRPLVGSWALWIGPELFLLAKRFLHCLSARSLVISSLVWSWYPWPWAPRLYHADFLSWPLSPCIGHDLLVFPMSSLSCHELLVLAMSSVPCLYDLSRRSCSCGAAEMVQISNYAAALFSLHRQRQPASQWTIVFGASFVRRWKSVLKGLLIETDAERMLYYYYPEKKRERDFFFLF